MTEPVRLFIGTSANGEDAEAEMVYEYSLRSHCSRNLDITWMRQTLDTDSPWGGWETQEWSTPFSGFRWAIPEVCGFKGRAIYTDVDMINMRDIGELFDIDLEGKPMAARKGTRFGGHEFCVIVFDCAKMEEYLMPIQRLKVNPSSHHRYVRFFSGNDKLVHELDRRWNCHDGEGLNPNEIWHLHFTKMSTQPWKPKWFTGTPEAHPRPDLVNVWHGLRDSAKANGYSIKIPNTPYVSYRIIGR